jgi:TPR repeat protein
MKWYRMAAEGGNTGAMTNIGLMFAHGNGVKENCALGLPSNGFIRPRPLAMKPP